MRFSFIVAIAVVALIATPAAAEKRIFGSYTCSRQVPCDRDGFTPEQWAQAGRDCLQGGLGYNAPDDVFNDIIGLDSSNCLTTNTEVIPQGQRMRLIPRCCMVERSPGLCSMSCVREQE